LEGVEFPTFTCLNPFGTFEGKVELFFTTDAATGAVSLVILKPTGNLTGNAATQGQNPTPIGAQALNYLVGFMHGHSAGSNQSAPVVSAPANSLANQPSLTGAIQGHALGGAAGTATSPGSAVAQQQQLKNLNSVLPQAMQDINQVGPLGNLLYEMSGGAITTPGYRQYQAGVNMLHPYGASLGITAPNLSTFGGGSQVSNAIKQNVNALNNKLSPQLAQNASQAAAGVIAPVNSSPAASQPASVTPVKNGVTINGAFPGFDPSQVPYVNSLNLSTPQTQDLLSGKQVKAPNGYTYIRGTDGHIYTNNPAGK